MKTQITNMNLDATNRLVTPGLLLIKPAIPFATTAVIETAVCLPAGRS
jgi:hypothetical protein